MLVVVVMIGTMSSDLTHADTRSTFRLGMMPLELEASSDTPLFGGSVDRVVDEYNTAAAAYERMTGNPTERIDASDLGVTETLLVFAPGLEVGSGVHFFRFELPLGYSDDLRSVGLGLYPLNLQTPIGRTVVLYGSAGASASWLDRPGPGDVGALVTVRAAVGGRIAEHVVFEVGYNAFALGGSVNRDRIEEMAAGRTLPQPSEAVAAGEARGLIDASLGLAF